jgi:hypothetical protein
MKMTEKEMTMDSFMALSIHFHSEANIMGQSLWETVSSLTGQNIHGSILNLKILYRLKKIIQWLKPLLHIREVPGSNLRPDTGHPDWDFRDFSQPFQANGG